MIGRLRILLNRPLDQRVGQGVLVLACAITVGFATIVTLTGSAGQPSGPGRRSTVPITAQAAPAEANRPQAPATSRRRPAKAEQDPQDRPGSDAARRADRELREHRALQHVPYRRGPVRIALVGARGRRAILLVAAPTRARARAAWRSFLHRYSDSGHAYIPRFRVRRGRHG